MGCSDRLSGIHVHAPRGIFRLDPGARPFVLEFLSLAMFAPIDAIASVRSSPEDNEEESQFMGNYKLPYKIASSCEKMCIVRVGRLFPVQIAI